MTSGQTKLILVVVALIVWLSFCQIHWSFVIERNRASAELAQKSETKRWNIYVNGYQALNATNLQLNSDNNIEFITEDGVKVIVLSNSIKIVKQEEIEK